jgi:hypothetical protein
MAMVGRRGIIVAILLIQVLAIGYARTTDARYLAWAPYDQISFYSIGVEVEGTLQPAHEVVERYPLDLWIADETARGRENRSMAHVHHLIERTEGNLDDEAVVVVVWTTNGGEEQRWTIP